MKENKLKFGVIGSGSWGTALIKILCENNDEINWYVRNKDNIDFIYKNSFNPNYLIQGIEVLDGNKAFLRFSGNDKPAVIQGEEETYQYLLMPVRTSE